ncbi:hypothetical protein FRC11_004840 [Ceratobasidium sp. 423]|nr:hypothetical protein FRC11_004840 [Ceratobasidium sp. 423]
MTDNPSDTSRSKPKGLFTIITRSNSRALRRTASVPAFQSLSESSSPLTTLPSSHEDDKLPSKKLKSANNTSTPTASNIPSPTSRSRRSSIHTKPEVNQSKVPESQVLEQIQDASKAFESITSSPPDEDLQVTFPTINNEPNTDSQKDREAIIDITLNTTRDMLTSSYQTSSIPENPRPITPSNQLEIQDSNITPKASRASLRKSETPSPKSQGSTTKGDTPEDVILNIIQYEKDLEFEYQDFLQISNYQNLKKFSRDQLNTLVLRYHNVARTFGQFQEALTVTCTEIDNMIDNIDRENNDDLDQHMHYESDEEIHDYESELDTGEKNSIHGTHINLPDTINTGPYAGGYFGNPSRITETNPLAATWDFTSPDPGSFEGQVTAFMNRMMNRMDEQDNRLQRIEGSRNGTSPAFQSPALFPPPNFIPRPFPPFMGVVDRPASMATPPSGAMVGDLGTPNTACPLQSEVAQPSPRASPSKDVLVVVPGPTNTTNTTTPKTWANTAASKPTKPSAAPKPNVKASITNALKIEAERKAASNPANIRYIVKFEHRLVVLPPTERLCHQMRESLTNNNRTLGGGRIIATRWSEKGNLTIEFSLNTPRESIKNAAAALIAPLRAGSYTFEPQEPITKIVVTNVPTGVNVTGQIFSSEHLDSRLRDLIPNYKNAKIFLQPSWITNPLTIHNEGCI